MSENKNYRFVKQEIILRFFAFLDRREKYNGQVGKFLNDYMHPNRDPDDEFIDQKREIFNRVNAVLDLIFPNGPQQRIPTAVVEAMLVGIANNIDHAEGLESVELVTKYEQLRQSAHFRDEGLAEGLSKKEKVEARLDEANRIFSE